MNNPNTIYAYHLCFKFLILAFLVIPSYELNTDGILLLSFKYSIISDPIHTLQNWNYYDDTPCSWNGVTCGGTPGVQENSIYSRVTALSLPNSQLLGSIPADLGLIENLRILNLSNNSLNSSLPSSLFNSTNLQFLDLSNNMFSGQLPSIGQLQSLEFLNLSDNSLAGELPVNLSTLQNLTIINLSNNYFFGGLPGGFNAVRVLDLSSNLLSGSLPRDFGGYNLDYMNVSYNKLSGKIPLQFAQNIPANATIDLSFNNLTGEIPTSTVFSDKKASYFDGNPNLCGPPTTKPCPITLPSSPANVSSSPTSPPAIAAIPKIGSNSQRGSRSSGGLRTITIVGIIVGDIAGVTILAIIFFYVYYLKKTKKSEKNEIKKEASVAKDSWSSSSSTSSSSSSKGFTRWSCLRKIENGDDVESESGGSDDDADQKSQLNQRPQGKAGTLVSVDGEKELELETLLKASAYILGATGSSIMYKAVLEDGTAFAVRRIGECHVDRFRDFETHVRVIAKLVHPNLVRIRGFYWGVDENLVIYDFVPNGSLANARYRKAGSSPCHLPWEARLKIAKGMARGLSFLHDKKHVHGNLKPSNVLLGSDMEPRIGDFGLEKLLVGDTSSKAGGSARNFGSKRSTASRDSFQDFSFGPSPSPSPSSIGGLSLYHAPESLRSLKPNPKWDVYSFGVILLELLTGKVIVVDELGQGNNGLVVEDKNRAFRMADMAIRADVEGKEEALLACFKLGYSCASPVPQKRPSMKEALQVLEKIPSSTSSYFYGH